MFLAIPSAISAFGAANAGVGVAVATTGAVDAGANLAALNPALGLIGQDFLLAFGAAQASHTASVSELAALYGGMAASSAATVAAYSATEAAGVAGLLASAL